MIALYALIAFLLIYCPLLYFSLKTTGKRLRRVEEKVLAFSQRLEIPIKHHVSKSKQKYAAFPLEKQVNGMGVRMSEMYVKNVGPGFKIQVFTKFKGKDWFRIFAGRRMLKLIGGGRTSKLEIPILMNFL